MKTAKMIYALVKIVLSVATLTSLSACGVGVEGDNQYSAQQQKDADALKAKYNKVVGVYSGVLNSSSSGQTNVPATLELYPLETVNPTVNPDGTTRTLPVLLGRFQLANIVSTTDYVTMIGNFDTNTSAVVLSPAAAFASGAATVDVTSISVAGTVGVDSADVIVKKQGREWGHFTGTRTSRIVGAPTSNDETERRNRLYTVYHKIEGNYDATIDTGSQQIPVSLTISIKEKAGDSPGVTIPVLVAQYRRLDVSSSVGQYQLAVSYDQISNLMSMIATSGGSPAVPGSDYLSAAGTWTNGNLDVVLRDRNGYAGELIATRKQFRK
jgi:hypothetical protein